MVSKFTQNIRHPLVANSFYLYLAHFADYLLLLLILPFIARVLGPSALGEVGLAQTFGLFYPTTDGVWFSAYGHPPGCQNQR